MLYSNKENKIIAEILYLDGRAITNIETRQAEATKQIVKNSFGIYYSSEHYPMKHFLVQLVVYEYFLIGFSLHYS